MATARQRKNGMWEFIVKRKGVLAKPIYATFDTEADGRRWAMKVESDLAHGIMPRKLSETKVSTIEELIELYLCAGTEPVSEMDRKLLPIISSRYGSTALAKVSYRWAESIVQDMKRNRRLSPSTIKHHCGALSRCFGWAVRTARMVANPISLFRDGYANYTKGDRVEPVESVARDRRLQDGEEMRIRAAIGGDGEMALLFDMALESAMRMSEMYTLEARQIDLKQRTIFLERTKNGSKRQVPISSTLLTALDGMPAKGSLFSFWKPGVRREMVTAKLSRRWARIAEKAGCPDLRFHDLRHEATSRLFERTEMSDLEVMSITGHKSYAMVQRYAHLRGSVLATKMW